MSQAGGGSLAKGLIEITGNVAPLEASLKQAEGSVQASLGRMQAQVAAGGAAPGGRPQTATDQAAGMAAAAAASGRFNQTLGDQAAKAKAAQSGVAGLTQSITTATAGFRGIVGAVQSTIGAITAALGWIGLITTAVTFLIEKLKERSRVEAEGRQDLLRLAAEGAALDKQRLIDRTQGIEREIRQLDDAYQKRIDDINRVYNAELEAAAKLPEAKQQAERDAAKQRATDRAADARQQYREELDTIKRNADEQVRQTERTEAQKNRELEKQLMGPRERMLADYEDKKAAIEDAMRKNAGNKDAANLNKIHQERLRLLKQQLDQELKDLDDKKAKEDEATRLQARQQAEAFAEAQRAAFAGLRDEINSLYSTNQLEVGIGRVAQLMEVLISKTGVER